jgi:hypothetical protein
LKQIKRVSEWIRIDRERREEEEVDDETINCDQGVDTSKFTRPVFVVLVNFDTERSAEVPR